MSQSQSLPKMCFIIQVFSVIVPNSLLRRRAEITWSFVIVAETKRNCAWTIVNHNVVDLIGSVALYWTAVSGILEIDIGKYACYVRLAFVWFISSLGSGFAIRQINDYWLLWMKLTCHLKTKLPHLLAFFLCHIPTQNHSKIDMSVVLSKIRLFYFLNHFSEFALKTRANRQSK